MLNLPWMFAGEIRFIIRFELLYVSFIILPIIGGFGCPKEKFLCKNKICLPATVKCNGKNDCNDNSDEIDGCVGIRNLENLIIF